MSTEQAVVNGVALSYKSSNPEVVAAFRAMGINVDKVCTVTDIRPTADKDGRPSHKSSVYCIAEVNLGSNNTGNASFDSMSEAERLAYGFSKLVMRGRITFDDALIESFGIKQGSKLSLNTPNGDVNFVLRVYERALPFYAGQQAVGFKNNAGIFEPKLVNGKPYYRDTKVVSESELAQSPHNLPISQPLSVAGLVQ